MINSEYTVIRLMNGSTVLATLSSWVWIEVEGAFHGRADDGERYYFWDVSVGGFCDNFRREGS